MDLLLAYSVGYSKLYSHIRCFGQCLFVQRNRGGKPASYLIQELAYMREDNQLDLLVVRVVAGRLKMPAFKLREILTILNDICSKKPNKVIRQPVQLETESNCVVLHSLEVSADILEGVGMLVEYVPGVEGQRVVYVVFHSEAVVQK
jgi:hypothetical protein